VKIIRKSNGGQLSAFSAGFAESTGDVLFFLDADDAYEPRYVERMLRVYRERPDVGYAFCGRRVFGNVDAVERPCETETDLGYSAAVVALGRVWLGASTSCVSMRRATLSRVLPARELEPWLTICADVCLAYGSSLAGARKYCVPDALVRYRAHTSNRYFGRLEDGAARYQRRLKAQAILKHYTMRFGLCAESLGRLLHVEFATIPQPSWTQLKRYSRAAVARRGAHAQGVWQATRMWRHYRATRRSAPSGARPVPEAQHVHAAPARAA